MSTVTIKQLNEEIAKLKGELTEACYHIEQVHKAYAYRQATVVTGSDRYYFADNQFNLSLEAAQSFVRRLGK